MTNLTAARDRALELLDKALVTAAEGALLAVGSESLAVDAFAIDWDKTLGYALGGAVLSLLINVARGGLTGRRTAAQDASTTYPPSGDNPYV